MEKEGEKEGGRQKERVTEKEETERGGGEEGRDRRGDG